MPTSYHAASLEEAIIKAMMGTCKPCCEGGNPGACGCDLCCTLKGQVQFGDGSGWDTAIEVSLACIDSFTQSKSTRCCSVDEFGDPNCEIDSFHITHQTMTGGSGRTPVIVGFVQIGWANWTTTMWGSDEFDGSLPTGLVSAKYQLVMIHTKWTYTNMDDEPLEGYTDCCVTELRLQIHGVDETYPNPSFLNGLGWEFWKTYLVATTTTTCAVILQGYQTVEEEEALCSPWVVDGGYDDPLSTTGGYGISETWTIYCPGTYVKNRLFMVYAPTHDDCAYFVRMMAFDDDNACALPTGDRIGYVSFAGGEVSLFPTTARYQATWAINTCSLTGAATSGVVSPLDAVSAPIPGDSWSPADSQFDAGDSLPGLVGYGVKKTFTNGELKITTSTVTPVSEGDTPGYLAVYAALICGTGGNTRTYYFKTRDFSYSDADLTDPVSVFSFTGLTPFKYVDAGTPTLTCPDVTLDLELKVKLGACDAF